MLMTILEASVTSERWQKLANRYRGAIKKLPMALIQTFLVQDIEDHNIWRIISEWRSREEFDRSSASKEHDANCIEIFRSVGVEPTCRIFLVHGHHKHV